jgi:hypothetical protein
MNKKIKSFLLLFLLVYLHSFSFAVYTTEQLDAANSLAEK